VAAILNLILRKITAATADRLGWVRQRYFEVEAR